MLALLAAGCVSIPDIDVAGVISPRPSAPASPGAPRINPTQGPSAPSTPKPTGTKPTATPSETPTNKPPGTPNPSQNPPPTAAATPTTPTATFNPDDPACTDDAYSLEGFAWNTVYRWHYNSESTPSNLDAATVLALIETSFDNIVDERNDCGRPDNVHAFDQYQGKTTLKSCTDQPDGQNTIAWGGLPPDLSPDTIAYTCPFSNGDGIAYEADIVINDEIPWALSADDCHFQELLEPTITHEAGHVFGLGHVSEKKHPWLTMSTTSNGPCNDDESTLGLGDMLGLESLYPGN